MPRVVQDPVWENRCSVEMVEGCLITLEAPEDGGYVRVMSTGRQVMARWGAITGPTLEWPGAEKGPLSKWVCASLRRGGYSVDLVEAAE